MPLATRQSAANLFKTPGLRRTEQRGNSGGWIAALLAGPLVLIAGCGGGLAHSAPNPANAAFSLSPSARTLTTNGQVAIKAFAPTGAAAPVKWRVLGGDNDGSLGQGAIDANGNYTPPAALTRDSIEVQIQAQLRNDPARTATEVLTVVPGFLQPLTPENAALAAGGSVQVSAQIAEVGGGSVDWRLATAATGGKPLGAAYGSFSQESCQHSPRDYTVCTAVYTAPVALPSAVKEVYVIASVAGVADAAVLASAIRQPVHVLLTGAGIASTPLTNQSVQTSLMQLGSSGGNNNDADTTAGSSSPAFINDCCGGTLGALLHDEAGSQYILSNNHVLAESDQARMGDTIVQPALIDRNCDQNAGRTVGSLRYVVPLANAATNVDAALAEVAAATVDPGGAILQLGSAGTGPNGSIGAAAPAAGPGQAISPELFTPEAAPLFVAKSGRTTGLTCSSIDAVDLSIEVDYYKDCAETQPYYRKTFAGQIGIGGDGFSDSGDSGALIVNSANAQPLALYFAGGTDNRGGGLSVASPIHDVLAALDAESGRKFSIVGGAEHPVSCLNYDSKPERAPVVPESLRKQAEAAVRKNSSAWINPAAGILEVASGASADAPGSPAILVYVDKSKENVSVPLTLGGFRTLVVPVEPSALTAGSAPAPEPLTGGLRLAASVLEAAREVQRSYAKKLMADPAIFGVGVTQSRDNPSEAALLVLVDLSRTPRSMPPVVGGLRVRYQFLQRFHVTRSRYAGAPHPSSCRLRSLAARGSGLAFDPARPTPLPLP
jgi:hypothetical protein